MDSQAVTPISVVPTAIPAENDRLKVSIFAENLTLKFVKKKCFKSKKNGQNDEEKYILKNVNMNALPGEILFILGPSGSGKSSLLNLLAGRIRKKKSLIVSGQVYYNGECKVKDVSKISSYVMQNEKLSEFLTVEETLNYAAALKMKRCSREERKKRVDEVIRQLGLEKTRKTYVGGSIKKGLSGGEKRRLAIAIELLDNPSILFLDEPTTGLDSSLAFDVLQVLMTFARSTQRTIVCTVHQPRSQVFAMFDQLLLLSAGEVVYHGPGKDSLKYFSSIGYDSPANFNPADFLLDILSVRNEPPALRQKSFLSWVSGDRIESFSRSNSRNIVRASLRKNDGIEDIKGEISGISQIGRSSITQEALEKLPQKFLDSEYFNETEKRVVKAKEYAKYGQLSVEKNMQARLLEQRAFWFDFFSDTATLTSKVFIGCLRNPLASIMQLVINIFLGLILGGLFFQLDSDGKTNSSVQNILGCLFFISASLTFSTLQSLMTFPDLRIMFNRDTANGSYSPISFFIALNIGESLFHFVPPLLFGVFIYWMSGLGPTWHQFLKFLLVVVLGIYCSAGLMYSIGASVPEGDLGQRIAPLVLVVFMLLSGFYLRDDSIPSWISWLKWISLMRFTFFAAAVNQFIPGGTYGTIQNDVILTSSAGIATINSFWFYVVILLILGTGYRLVAFIFLKFLHRSIGLES